MPTILERYYETHKKSAELYASSQEVVAGGAAQSRVMYPYPYYIAKGDGAVKWDVDGNELIDYIIGFGSLILGNNRPEVTEAVERQLRNGTHMGTTTPYEVQWAELITNLMPAGERVRFTASGTEATLLAIRLARGFTGKSKLVKFREHYDGWHDYVALEAGITAPYGVPEATKSTVAVLDPDPDALDDYLSKDKDVAAVIMEPTGAHWGQFPVQNPNFLERVREITRRHDVLMIMDEVIMGFRVSRGGAHGKYGIMPDLFSMAKIVAGGLPGGAVGGRADIFAPMGDPDPAKRFVHPGTFNANPVSAAAGIAALEIIANEPITERADALADKLKKGLREALIKQEVTGHVHGVSSIVHLALGVEGETNDQDISQVPVDQLAEATKGRKIEMLKLAMLNEGVDMFGGIGFMTSAAHTEEQVERTVAAFERSLVAIRDEGYI
jgi:glutamate-1-semialdehyde 2,1-aminomutase